MKQLADLELTLRRTTDVYAVDVRFTPANSSAPVRLLSGDPPIVRLDDAALRMLREAALDMQEYSARLSDLFFADDRLAQAVTRAYEASQSVGANLRLRLVLDEREPLLHALHWEGLRSPQGGPLFSMHERLRFSRFLSSDDMQPLRPRSAGELKVLLVIAAPEDLDAYQLAPIDVEAEIARARAALGAVPLTVLANSTGSPVTMSTIAAALRDRPDILYLIAHGTLHRGQPFIWLEDDDGFAARTNAKVLVEQLQALEQRPLLTLLGSCQSAGNAAVEGVLNALGPQLAAAGIAAVLAFQGNVAQQAVATYMPTFFKNYAVTVRSIGLPLRHGLASVGVMTGGSQCSGCASSMGNSGSTRRRAHWSRLPHGRSLPTCRPNSPR